MMKMMHGLIIHIKVIILKHKSINKLRTIILGRDYQETRRRDMKTEVSFRHYLLKEEGTQP